MKTSRLKRVRREEKKWERSMSAMQKKVITVTCMAVISAALIFFSVDFIRAKKYVLPPIFCIPAIEYENGSKDYYGLFYKVWEDHNPFENETRYYFGFWLLPKNFNI